MSRIGLLLLAVLLLVAALGGGVRGMGAEPEFEAAPLSPAPVAPHPPGTGYFLPPMDLSHVTGQVLPGKATPHAVPASFDWRNTGKVTPVKNQGNCGSCYAFSYLGSLEAKFLIDGVGTWDLSENHAKECNWEEVNNFNGGSSCDGGNSFIIANLYSQTGSVLESCDPYVDSDVGCGTGCPYQQTVLDWRLIAGGDMPSTEVLKQYIYDHGPVATAMYVDTSQGFDGSYNGSTTFNYTAPSGQVNHGVVIVGWSNSLPPVPGGSTPADGWIVKNSWGTGWGASGYFYMTYGAGNLGYLSSFVDDWQTYDTDGGIWYYDEAGWNSALGQSGGSNTTAWALAKYIPGTNTNVTRVEFWTTDTTTDVDVYLYDDFNGTSTSNLLASKLNSSFDLPGYHSVALDSPLPVTSGNDIVAVVKYTNSSYGYPLAVDRNGPHETAKTYISLNGSTWTDLAGVGAGYDATIRLRTSSGAAAAPTVTSIAPASGQDTGTVHITNLAGSNFQPGAMVKLTKSGQGDIGATNVVVVNSSRITCDFNLLNVATGPWNVVVTNPDMQSGTLANGFTVTHPGPLDYVVYLPLVMRHFPPVPRQPALNPISNPDGDGNYNVSWSAGPAPLPSSYQLEEDDNPGFSSPMLVYSGSGTSTGISGRTPGTYYYRVRGLNAYGPGPWSNTESVDVGLVPAVPTLYAISNPDHEPAYCVDWNDVPLTDYYQLQEDDNAGFSSPAQYEASLSNKCFFEQAPGTYYYRVRACNAHGCSAWSNTQSVVVSSSGPNPGFWRTSGGATEFYVTSDRAYVDDFAIHINVSGCGSYKITHTPLEAIVSDHFSFSGSFYGNGTFSSATSCSGTTGLNDFYIPGCGYVSGGPWSYTATWQGAAQAPTGAGSQSVVVERVGEDAVKSFLTAELAPQ